MIYAEYYAALQDEVARFNRKCYWRYTPILVRGLERYAVGSVEIESDYLWYHCLPFKPGMNGRLEVRGLPDQEWTAMLMAVWEPRHMLFLGAVPKGTLFFSQPEIARMYS